MQLIVLCSYKGYAVLVLIKRLVNGFRVICLESGGISLSSCWLKKVLRKDQFWVKLSQTQYHFLLPGRLSCHVSVHIIDTILYCIADSESATFVLLLMLLSNWCSKRGTHGNSFFVCLCLLQCC